MAAPSVAITQQQAGQRLERVAEEDAHHGDHRALAGDDRRHHRQRTVAVGEHHRPEAEHRPDRTRREPQQRLRLRHRVRARHERRHEHDRESGDRAPRHAAVGAEQPRGLRADETGAAPRYCGQAVRARCRASGSGLRVRAAERLAPLEIGLIDELPVAADIAVLRAHDQHHALVVCRRSTPCGASPPDACRNPPGPRSRVSPSASKRAVPEWTKYSSSWVSW